jgi:hypothetical protein
MVAGLPKKPQLLAQSRWPSGASHLCSSAIRSLLSCFALSRSVWLLRNGRKDCFIFFSSIPRADPGDLIRSSNEQSNPNLQNRKLHLKETKK